MTDYTQPLSFEAWLELVYPQEEEETYIEFTLDFDTEETDDDRED